MYTIFIPYKDNHTYGQAVILMLEASHSQVSPTLGIKNKWECSLQPYLPSLITDTLSTHKTAVAVITICAVDFLIRIYYVNYDLL